MQHGNPPLESGRKDAPAAARNEQLSRSNQALQAELSRAHQLSVELGKQLLSPPSDDSPDRQIRRAALNLMEDAIAARTRALEANAELHEKIAEQSRVEAALRETERELQEAIERHQQLNIELDRRVRERTRDLADREQRLRELSSELLRVEQKERQRLATLLHDHVQQLLVAAKLRVDFIAAQSQEPARARLNEVVEILADAINATRDLSVQLAPPLLHDQGLASALDWLSARLRNMHGLVIHQDFDSEADPRTETGRDILYHTAHELLLNAVKHSESNEVELSLRREEGHYRLEIVDRGVGFDVIRSMQRGSFGLFQLRQRLENAGGELLIFSAPGRGTRVLASLPASNETPGDLRADPLLPERGDSESASSEKLSVVLADDHAIVRDGLRELIARHTDLELVGEAADGRAAIEIALKVRPRVVVLDVNMPRLNGIEAARQIKSQLPEIRIIGLSLDNSAETQRAMLEAGAETMLSKESAADTLIQAIRNGQPVKV